MAPSEGPNGTGGPGFTGLENKKPEPDIEAAEGVVSDAADGDGADGADVDEESKKEKDRAKPRSPNEYVCRCDSSGARSNA